MKRNYEKEATRWFIQASDEFNDANELRKMKKFYLALFHFQQATEKALKAFLYSKLESRAVFYTHSIADLSEMAIELDPDFKTISLSKKLDQYYILTRYPNGLPGGIPSRFFDDPKEAEDAMFLAKNVIDLIEKKIQQD
ncbi:MAG: HEPN domain-containing protein [Promethearchaeota archaeon]